MSRWLNIGVGVLCVALLAGCATQSQELRPHLAAAIAAAGSVEATADDDLAAFAPEQFLAGQAGHGLGGDLDLSASCGCAETSGGGPSGSGGPGGGPGVEHKQPARLRVIVLMPQLPGSR